ACSPPRPCTPHCDAPARPTPRTSRPPRSSSKPSRTPELTVATAVASCSSLRGDHEAPAAWLGRSGRRSCGGYGAIAPPGAHDRLSLIEMTVAAGLAVGGGLTGTP